VAVAMVFAIVLILCLPRKYVIALLFLAGFTIPAGQVLVLAGLHFTVYRILILAGLARWVTSRLTPPRGGFAGGFNDLDRVFTLWALLTFITFSLQWMETQALIKSLGTLLDSLGGYLVLRFFIRDKEDVRRTIKVFAVIATVLALCMINEQITRQNIFGLLGSVPIASADRAGGVRSQGTFAVYITAGVFGATLLPLFAWLWSDAKFKVAALGGMVGATVMTITSNSSTPLLAYAAGIVGLCFWPLRRHMRAVRWALVSSLIALHLVMKAPVWALIARIDLTGSSSGWHRYYLVDSCIRHFSDWWLLGYKNYNDWGWDMWDLSNQYVGCALTGGLVTLLLFIGIISRSFGRLGTARKLAEGDPKHQWFLWCLCAALLSHVVAYFGISYFDQMQVAWYALLATISAALPDATRSPAPQVQEAIASNYEPHAAMNWEMLETNH
jgi:hypothetical protein